jgi:hypothetical protein
VPPNGEKLTVLASVDFTVTYAGPASVAVTVARASDGARVVLAPHVWEGDAIGGETVANSFAPFSDCGPTEPCEAEFTVTYRLTGNASPLVSREDGVRAAYHHRIVADPGVRVISTR